MMMLVTENAPQRLRGRLSLWLAEIRAGTYVGVYSKRTRERIWGEVAALIGDGNAVMAWSAPNEAGFAFDTVGQDRRQCIMIDGLPLVRLHESEATP